MLVTAGVGGVGFEEMHAQFFMGKMSCRATT
jgi:hypothetical protein